MLKDGHKLGVMETRKALEMAKEAGLDLVEVAPEARPPVCKILDHGKLKYEEKKRAKEKRANSTKIQTKEMKFRPKTDTHDIEFKTKHIRRFLEEGNRCLLIVQFKGRERSHPDVGESLLIGVADSLSDISEVAKKPAMEGSRMSMMIVPLGSSA